MHTRARYKADADFPKTHMCTLSHLPRSWVEFQDREGWNSRIEGSRIRNCAPHDVPLRFLEFYPG